MPVPARFLLFLAWLVLSGCQMFDRGEGFDGSGTVSGGMATVKVRIHGIAKPRGTLNVGLYSSSETWLTTEYSHSKNGRVGRVGEVIEIILEDVPSGAYAVSLFQDLDDTSSLSRNAFGIPTDPWGMSNDAVGTLGPASFEAAVVKIEPPETVLDVRLRTGLGMLSDVPDLVEEAGEESGGD